MNKLVDSLDCGKVTNHSNGRAVVFRVSKFEDIINKIIPLFNQYNIEGIKALDYDDFCKAARLIEKKIHLTPEGLEQIQKIKLGMNRGRTFN